MHKKLAQALELLDIGSIALLDEKGIVVRNVSDKEHATALFQYLDLAGYLSPDLLEKAVSYLSAARPFPCHNETIIKHLKTVYERAHQNGSFNVNYFFDNFCNSPYFQVDDIIDLIVFLQQTAFDRQFGVERDKLKAKPWLVEHADQFCNLTTQLGIVTPLPPVHNAYCGTGIMGAASFRVRTRIGYFNSLTTNVGEVYALSGIRELSKGLDEEALMSEMALAINKDKPATYVEKAQGTDKRMFLDGVNEPMMVHYLLQKLCPGKKIALVDSQVEKDHWRATTSQNAKDIAQIVIKKIQDGTIVKEKDNTFRFMIIAEQPYAGRMARQVQRAFNAEIQSKKLESSIQIIVEGSGPGVTKKELADIGILTRMNSELGSLMAERFNDARLLLKKNANLNLRDPKILLFMERDAVYKSLMSKAQTVQDITDRAECDAVHQLHDKVEESRVKNKVDVSIIAKAYAYKNNHDKVEEYRTQHQADVNLIAFGYAFNGNHAKVEEYRTLHKADPRAIADGYLVGGESTTPEFYRAINRLEAYGRVGESIMESMSRLKYGRENYWNPYWMNSGVKLDCIIKAVLEVGKHEDLEAIINNHDSALYKALNMSRITPVTFLGRLGFNQTKTVLAVEDTIASMKVELK